MNNAERIAEIRARINWLYANYEGCDWCCGGGDEELEALSAELDELGVDEEDESDA